MLGLTVAVILLAGVTLVKINSLSSNFRRLHERVDSLEAEVSESKSSSALHKGRLTRLRKKLEQQREQTQHRINEIEKTLKELQHTISQVSNRADDVQTQESIAQEESRDPPVEPFEIKPPFLSMDEFDLPPWLWTPR